MTMELRKWYLRAMNQFCWSKAESITDFIENAHDKEALAIEEICTCKIQEIRKAKSKQDNLHVDINTIHLSQCVLELLFINFLTDVYLVFRELKPELDKSTQSRILKACELNSSSYNESNIFCTLSKSNI